MISQTSTAIQNDIWGFCKYFLGKLNRCTIQDPELLASQLRHFYGINSQLSLQELRSLLINSLGISSVKPFKPVGEERGLFVKHMKAIEIFYRDDDWDGSQTFTVAHELREVLGAIFSEIDPEYQDAEGEELETQADAFAAAFIMQHEAFLQATVQCGFDPVFLHNEYHQSYVAVIVRMASVIRHHKSNVHFWGGVYDKDSIAPENAFKSLCFHRSAPYRPKTRYKMPNSLFPKRGQFVHLTNNFLNVCRTRRSLFIRRVTGLDFWNQFCLSLLIRPVIWRGVVSKLVIVALNENQGHLLNPQLKLCNPIVVEESYQLF